MFSGSACGGSNPPWGKIPYKGKESPLVYSVAYRKLIGGFETERRPRKRRQPLKGCGAWMRRKARRRPGSPKQDVEGCKANPPWGTRKRARQGVIVLMFHVPAQNKSITIKKCRQALACRARRGGILSIFLPRTNINEKRC